MNNQITYIAHSSLEEEGKSIPEQPYEKHICEVYNGCKRELDRISKHINNPFYLTILRKSVLLAAIYHDLGKLDEQAQKIMKKEIVGKMINHVDAGVAHLLSEYKKNNDDCYLIGAYFILAHHIGLPNPNEIFSNPFTKFRDTKSLEKYCMGLGNVKEHVDSQIHQYINIHRQLVKIEENFEVSNNRYCKAFLTNTLMLKLGISLLVNADHEDTSKNYNEIFPIKMKKIDFKKNLFNLENKIKELENSFIDGKLNCSKDRFEIRKEFFNDCGRVNTNKNFFLIDGTVGVGKTLSAMRLAMRVANDNKLDTITFILPYIALIDQSASEYIRYLFNDEKEAEYNIEVIHSIFKTRNLFHRKYSKAFNAPINLTTSVNFFNVITSNITSIFKNLIKFVGNVIVIDEYPAIADYEFWPLILDILSDMSKYFSCKFIFSSGTPVRHWELFDNNLDVECIVNENLYSRMIGMEDKRVKIIDKLKESWSFEKLSKEILLHDKSCFVIMNTRKKAVKMVDMLQRETDRKVFLRFSGLVPQDRIRQFENIKECINRKEDIIVVATQGSDIGLDISFHHGFKESSNYDSVLQMKGRINRGCEYHDSFLTIFRLCDDPNGNGTKYYDNPSLKNRKRVLETEDEYRKIISPTYSTEIAKMEIDQEGASLKRKMEYFQNLWESRKFEELGDEFNLINMPCIHLLINPEIEKRIKDNQYVSYAELQSNIVNIIFGEKTLHLLKDLIEPLEKDIEENIDNDVKEDNKQEDPKNNLYGLYFWKGCYDHENFGIFVDPVFDLVTKKALII